MINSFGKLREKLISYWVEKSRGIITSPITTIINLSISLIILFLLPNTERYTSQIKLLTTAIPLYIVLYFIFFITEKQIRKHLLKESGGAIPKNIFDKKISHKNLYIRNLKSPIPRELELINHLSLLILALFALSFTVYNFFIVLSGIFNILFF